MASWATIAQKEPPKKFQIIDTSQEKKRVAVIDANAIIQSSGLLNLVREADRIVTTPEVLKEVRDKQSRALLASLPFKIETQDPHEESLAAVVSFARATGDAHALSTQDIRLIALARTIEVSYYGPSHLRTAPPAPIEQKKSRRQVNVLPGWGAEGGDWAELDRLNEEEIAAAEAALGHQIGAGGDVEQVQVPSASRIAALVQELSLEDSAASGGDGGAAGVDNDDESQKVQQAIAAQLAAEEAAQATESDSDQDGESEEDGDEWEVAAKTHNKQRRAKRRVLRKAQREAEEREEQRQAQQAQQQDQHTDDEDDDSEDDSSDDDEEEEEEEEQMSEAGTIINDHNSAICIVTGDFAMQNVILQMGLRLAAPDGKRITSVSRWVLRCSACFNVTKDTGRVFCPRCGNAALDRVHVTVRPDGSEQYGVRKKHILRGTKFSLPKPKGGRNNDVILSEDVLMMKARRLRKKAGNKEELDPFAPEYGDETWHQRAVMAANDKSTSALVANWKRNPNERKHIATNRRRK